MDLERIIENLMVSNTDIIRTATKELEEALTKPESVFGLFMIMTSHVKPENRQLAAIQLKRHLTSLQEYQKLLLEIRAQIKGNIVNVVFNEKCVAARGSIVQFLGVLVAHESRMDEVWVEDVLQFIFNQCSAADMHTVENGLFVSAKLADIAPQPFLDRFGVIKGFILAALKPFEEKTSTSNLPPSIISNVLSIMSALVPIMIGNTDVEETFEASIPYIVNVATKFAVDNQVEHFRNALDVLQNMAEFAPNLLNQNFRLLMEFAFDVSSNQVYDNEMRIMSLNFVDSMVGKKKKLLLQLNFIEPIMNMALNIIANELENGNTDEFFMESEQDTPLNAVTSLVDTMAFVIPSEKLIPILLTILEPAFQNTADSLRRRAAFIVLASISEGCGTVIREEYLEPMMAVLKHGLNDRSEPSVRNAVLFAIVQFAENLQPEISDYANEILPLLLRYVHNIIQAQTIGGNLDQKISERAFYAIEVFCESMEESLAPYMEELMGVILEILSNNHGCRLKNLALGLIESTATSYAGCLLPWFNSLMELLKPLVLLETEEDAFGLRSQAIDTLAAIARYNKKQFSLFVPELMQQCVQWIEKAQDIDVRKSIINLFGALSAVVGENLAPILPTIFHHMIRVMNEGNGLPEDPEFDLDDSLSISSETTQYGNNPYLEAKVQVIDTIQELSESCMKIILPSANNLLDMIFNFLDHGFIDLRSSSIAAAKTLTINWMKLDPNATNAKQALHTLLLKLEKTICNDVESEVVVEALDGVSDILVELGTSSLPTKEMRDLIANCIKSDLTYGYSCFPEKNRGENEDNAAGIDVEDDAEIDKYVIEFVANLLPSLGKAVDSIEFSKYFEELEPFLINHLKTKNGIISALANCYDSLGKNVGAYFSKHFKLMDSASKSNNFKSRQNGIFGLGKLIRVGKEISYEYFPQALGILYHAIESEKKRIVVDNVLGSVARLILTNSELVPLEQALPAMLEKLPIVEDNVESIVVMECFELLYSKYPALMQEFTEEIVEIALRTLVKDLSENEYIAKSVFNLMLKIRSVYPNEWDQAMSSPALIHLILKVREKVVVFFC